MTLEERLGKDIYAKRRAGEDERIAEALQYLSPKFTYVKIHVIRPIEVFLMKLFGAYAYGRREFHNIEVVENEIKISNLPDSLSDFTIMQMSDLHIDIDPKLIQTIKGILPNITYDVCVMTGDYKNLTVGDSSESVRLMTELRSAIKSEVFATLGNHDTLDIVDPLEKAGYTLLLNEHAEIVRGDASVTIAGIDDPYIYKTHSIGNALKGAPEKSVKILLAHSPNPYLEAESAGVDAMLCGHTHGGQVCLPNGYPILCHEHCPRKFITGRWQHGALQGYTSRGTGGCGIPIRFFCRPEITLHRLVKAI